MMFMHVQTSKRLHNQGNDEREITQFQPANKSDCVPKAGNLPRAGCLIALHSAKCHAKLTVHVALETGCVQEAML